MWKIKLISRNEELPVDEELEEIESDLNMKTDKNDGEIKDVNSSAQKKLKQARLPFQILSPKSSPVINKDSEIQVKKRKLSNDSAVEVSKTKLCKTDIKENFCGPVHSQDVIVVEDNSVDLIDTVDDNDITSTCNKNDTVEEENKPNLAAEQKNTPCSDENKITKKRSAKNCESNSNKRKKESSSVVENDETAANKNAIEDNVVVIDLIDGNSVEIIDKPDDGVKNKTPELAEKNYSSNSSIPPCNIDNERKCDSKSDDSSKTKVASSDEKINNFPLKGVRGRKKKSVTNNTVKITVKNIRESKRVRGKVSSVQKPQVINSKDVKNKITSVKFFNVKKETSLKARRKEDSASEDKNTDGKDGANKKEISEETELNSSAVLKTPEKAEVIEESPENVSKDSDSLVSKESPINNNSSSASSIKTPKSMTKRSTPKQLLKKLESEKKQNERERLRKEKEDKLNKMKDERKRLKLEKEEAKKREKEEKEKKRLKELELKNEEKRAKEEEKKAKEEEKKAKEEEKKKREEAKEEEKRKRDEAKEEERKKKEAVKRKEEKAASAFASFFTPKRSDNKASLSSSSEDVTDSAVAPEKFMPFEVKADMRLAAIQRRILETESKIVLDNALKNQKFDISELYIEKLKSKKHVPLCDTRTWSLQDDTEDDVIIIESEIVEECNEEETKSTCEKKRMQRPKAKLLYFEENRRPPYWGTWRKKSSIIGPRKPFGQDNTMFEYDIDSDDEWEEEEPGESLHGSDDEKESEDEYEVDNKLFVPHGYLSDEEAQDEIEDMSPEAQKAKLKFLEIEFEAEMKEKTEKLKPRLIGCVWFNNSVEDPKSVGSHIAELLLSRRCVLWDNVTVPVNVEPSNSLSSSPSNTPAKSELNKTTKTNVFPESAVPDLIKLIHGNRFKHKFLVEEFYNYMSQNSKSIFEVPSKNAISNKKRELSEWTVYPPEESSNHPMIGRRCWYVPKEVREKFGVSGQTSSDEDAWMYSLEVPRSNVSLNSSNVVEQTPPVTPITKFTKVLSLEERQKQLTLQSTSSSTSSSEKIKQSCVTPVSSQKLVKNTSSKKARRSVMDAFMKSKGGDKKSNSSPSVIEIIELSPDKPTTKVSHEQNHLQTDSSKTLISNLSADKNTENQSQMVESSQKETDSKKVEVAVNPTITPSKPIRRIKPICLSPMKLKKKM